MEREDIAILTDFAQWFELIDDPAHAAESTPPTADHLSFLPSFETS